MHGLTPTTNTLGGAFGWVLTAGKTYTWDNNSVACGPKLVFFIQVHLAILEKEKTSVKCQIIKKVIVFKRYDGKKKYFFSKKKLYSRILCTYVVPKLI